MGGRARTLQRREGGGAGSAGLGSRHAGRAPAPPLSTPVRLARHAPTQYRGSGVLPLWARQVPGQLVDGGNVRRAVSGSARGPHAASRVPRLRAARRHAHPASPAADPPARPPNHLRSCVILYCVFNVILTAFCYVRERDSFMVTQPKLVSPGYGAGVHLAWCGWWRAGGCRMRTAERATSARPAARAAGSSGRKAAVCARAGAHRPACPPLTQGREHGIRLSSHMERYGDTYTLVIANADKYEDRCVGAPARDQPGRHPAAACTARARSRAARPRVRRGGRAGQPLAQPGPDSIAACALACRARRLACTTPTATHPVRPPPNTQGGQARHHHHFVLPLGWLPSRGKVQVRGQAQALAPRPPTGSVCTRARCRVGTGRAARRPSSLEPRSISQSPLPVRDRRSDVKKLLDQYERIDKVHEGSRPKALNPKKQR